MRLVGYANEKKRIIPTASAACGSGGDERKQRESLQLRNNTPMKLFDREHQIPILAPYDISIFNGKTLELTGVKIFVILRMRMPTNEFTHIHFLCGIVTECQKDSQITRISSICNVQSVHIPTSYILVLILLHLTACFITKNFTHLSIMFL